MPGNNYLRTVGLYYWDNFDMEKRHYIKNNGFKTCYKFSSLSVFCLFTIDQLNTLERLAFQLDFQKVLFITVVELY